MKTRVWVDIGLIGAVQKANPETTDMNYVGVVNWALRKLSSVVSKETEEKH